MDNSLGEMAKEAQSFSDLMKNHFSIPTVLWDERLTSVQAERAMIDAGVSRNKEKNPVTLLLQLYCYRTIATEIAKNA